MTSARCGMQLSVVSGNRGDQARTDDPLISGHQVGSQDEGGCHQDSICRVTMEGLGQNSHLGDDGGGDPEASDQGWCRGLFQPVSQGKMQADSSKFEERRNLPKADFRDIRGDSDDTASRASR